MRVGAGGKTRGRERGSICEHAVGRDRRASGSLHTSYRRRVADWEPRFAQLSFVLLCTLCTIILLRWNEGGVAYSRVGADAEGRRGAA
jgi:hypothetical protein